MDTRVVVTTSQMWLATCVAAAILFVLVAVLRARIRPPFPNRLPLALLACGVLAFGILYGWAAWTFWDNCYSALLPSWAKWVAPAFGAAWGSVGALFWTVACRVFPERPLPLFLVLGGLHSVPGHVSGIFARGLLEKCAIVKGVSAASALTFGLFEFAIYWGLVLLAAHGVARIVEGRPGG